MKVAGSTSLLVLKGKGEVVGNLIAAQLGNGGIYFFSFGEYFEAKPLLALVEPATFSVKQHVWIDGVVYRRLNVGGIELKETLAAHEDTLSYTIINISNKPVKLRLKGGLQVFCWFNPAFKRQIAELANVSFRAIKGLGLEASYGNVYHLYIASNGLMIVKANGEDATYMVEIELNEGDTFTFIASGASSKEDALKRAEEAFMEPRLIESSRQNEVIRILKTAPKMGGLKPDYERLWKYMWYVMLSNRAHVKGHPTLINPFNMPSKFVFRHQWLWDSAFHAIVLSMHDVRMAEEELLNLFEAQKPDGRIPHEIFLSKEFCKLFWNVDDYSPWTTQPPVLAIAVDYIMRGGGSPEFLRRAFEALDSYDRWFRRHRDADGDQVMAYVDYLESGWDDSVRWDSPVEMFERNPEPYRRKYSEIRMAPVEAVDLNCLIYLQRKILSRLASKLGYEDKAAEYERLARETAEGVRKFMWDSETRFFYDVVEENHELIRVKTPTAFLTLFTGLANEKQSESLIQHIFNPKEFWTFFPLPTVSADNPKYHPKGYWRGRSWINMVWFTYHGLRRYGFEAEAERLALRVLDLMAEKPTCNENYDSSNGEPLGAPDFGWSTLALEMLKNLAKGSSCSQAEDKNFYKAY